MIILILGGYMYISFGRVNFNFRRIFKQIINKRFEFECKI